MSITRALFTAGAIGAWSLSASAQITITPVIAPGQSAPGSATGTFNGPQHPTCQTIGRLALQSFLTNTPNPGGDNNGVWQAGGGVTLAAIVGQPITGSGAVNIVGVSPPIQNRNGGVFFAGRMDSAGGFAFDAALCYSAGGLAEIAAREGDAVAVIPGALIGEVGVSGVGDLAFNDAGRSAFIAPLTGVPSPGNRVILATDGATRNYALVARTGDPSPTPGGAPFSFITSPSINGAGDVAFFSNMSAAPFFGLFVRPMGGAIQKVVAAGDSAPGMPAGWTHTTFVGQNSGPPQMNDAGQYVIAGGAAAPGGFPSRVGVWRGAPGAFQLLAQSQTQAPGAPIGANFNDFTPLINGSGGVIFYSNLSFGAQNAGVWIVFPVANAQPRLLTLLNVQAPDMPPGTLLISISNGGVSFNNRAEGLINGSMNYVVNSTPANGLFAGRPGRLRKVVASGDMLEVTPGVFRTVISVLAWSWNSPESGRHTSINDRGEVAFSCSFVGGGGGAFIARLPHPCPGDATADDLVGFADLNAVLASYNTVLGNPLYNHNADFDQDDDVDFSDLNAVLGAFNTGC